MLAKLQTESLRILENCPDKALVAEVLRDMERAIQVAKGEIIKPPTAPVAAKRKEANAPVAA